MGIRHGKLVISRKTINFLELTAEEITRQELILEKRPAMTGVIRYLELATGDEKKRLIVIESMKVAKNKEASWIQSSVEFHKESDLWFPRILRLKLGEGGLLHFVCDVDRTSDGYEYTVRGPISSKSV